MVDKKTDQKLNWIFGDPPTPVPADTNSRGRSGRVANRRQAGVTIDHPLTSMAQELANDLKQDALRKERELDPRTTFDKRYDIRDGVAHVTPDQFRDLFINSQILKTLRAKSVRHVEISNSQGSTATFYFFEGYLPPDKLDQPIDSIKITDAGKIIEQGVFGCLGNQSAILLRRQSTGFHGLIRAHHIPVELVTHAENVSSPSGQRYTSNMNPVHGQSVNKEGNMVRGNARSVFETTADFKDYLQSQFYGAAGQVITCDVPNRATSPDNRIGVLYAHEHFTGDLSNMPEISIYQIGRKIAENNSMQHDEFLRYIFGDNAGFVLKERVNSKKGIPLAVLIRFDHASFSPTPENI